MNKTKILISALCFFIINMFFLVPAFAGIRIDKPKIRLSVAPGSYASGEVKVENNGKDPAAVKVYLEDWVYNAQDGGKEFMPKGTTALSASNWITFYPADFTVPVGGIQMVRYTVSVPKDAKGGNYAVMFFETGGGEMPAVDEKGNNVMVKVLNRLGALFYIEPEGTIQKTAEIKNLAATEKLNNLVVAADFVNTGNTDITAKGTFDVIDSYGMVFARGVFDEVYTLAHDKASLESTAKSVDLKAGDYDLLLTIEFENGGNIIKEASFNVSASGVLGPLKIKD